MGRHSKAAWLYGPEAYFWKEIPDASGQNPNKY